ncbi:MAG: hypothetical protein ACFFB5_01595 [Promethearchaeota archaeon]
MSIDPTYIKSAVETLELIQRINNYLKENQKANELPNFLSQIESKGEARVRSSLGQTLGIDIPLADQEGKPTKYWEGVRDMARLAKKQFLTLNDDHKFTQFLRNTSASLSSRMAPEEKPISPLEELLQEAGPKPEETQPISPLEEILTEPVSIPEPKPISEPTPAPEPTIRPEPTPMPEPTPAPEPTITPEPVFTPEPKPIPEPTPAPEPAITPEPPKQTYTPEVTPRASEPSVPPPPDKFQALDEALKSSGLDRPSDDVAEPSPSLTSMLLQKDETGDREEDDMLSLSLREALKILRDEDED